MHQIQENFGASEVLHKSVILAALFGCPMLFSVLLLASLQGNVVYAHVSDDLKGFGTLWEPNSSKCCVLESAPFASCCTDRLELLTR